MLIDIKTFLLINALSFIFSGISEMFIDFNVREKIYADVAENEQPVKQGNILLDFVDGIKYIKSQKWLIALGAVAIFFNMFLLMGLTIPLSYITRTVWGFSNLQYGLLNIMFSVRMLLASVVLSTLHI